VGSRVRGCQGVVCARRLVVCDRLGIAWQDLNRPGPAHDLHFDTFATDAWQAGVPPDPPATW
jgi:hypothetical protein